MSMILDALSRAEKERQADNNIHLDPTRYTTTSTIKEDRFKKWVLIALVANLALITVLAASYLWKNFTNNNGDMHANTAVEQQAVSSDVNIKNMEEVSAASENTFASPSAVDNALLKEQTPSPQVNLIDDSSSSTAVSSLLDEAQVKKARSRVSAVKKPTAKKTIKSSVKKIPPVQFSSKPLSEDNNVQLANNRAPSVATINEAVTRERLIAGTGAYTRLSDLPISERAQLSQYEVNVHVYDTNPSSRFVLINMIKYKEGDRISGSNASVASIVPEGVVVNHNSQQVLIERNQ